MLNGTFANLVDKLALLVVQLATIPLLSQQWGAAGYGTWLMLMTIPAYVAVSDFGLGTAAGTEITQRVARGDTTGALQSFQSAWIFVFGVMLAIALLAAAYAALGASDVIKGQADIPLAVLIVTVYAIVAVQTTTLAVVYRATHKYAHAMLISAAVIVVEGMALGATVTLGGQLIAAATAMLTVRVVGWLVTYLVLRRLEPWVRLGFDRADLATVRRLANPSIAALSLTLATSMSLQGVVLVLGWVGGPVAAALFGASRFIARIPLQFSGLVVRASIPELTRAQVDKDPALIRRLTRLNVISALVPTLPMIPILTFAGPPLLRFLSHDTLNAPWWLFSLLASTTTVGALWQAAASGLIANNQQARFAYIYSIVSALALGLLLLPGMPPLVTAGAATLAAELVVTIVVLRITHQSDLSDHRDRY